MTTELAERQTKFESLSTYQQWLLRHADSDYVAARVLYFTGYFYPQVLSKLHEALEKHVKLLYLILTGIPDQKADGVLKKYRHRLGVLRQDCVSAAGHDARIRIAIEDQHFVGAIHDLDTYNYQATARYPGPFAVSSSSIVQIFDEMIFRIRDFCLRIDQSPVKVVFENVGSLAEWPPVKSEFVRQAFYHDNPTYYPDDS